MIWKNTASAINFALRKRLLKLGIAIEALDTIQTEVTEAVEAAFERAKAHDEPDPATLAQHAGTHDHH